MSDLQTMRNRPNFFVIGAGKAGTTRLHYLLGQHPEVFTSRVKEPGLFNNQTPKEQAIAAYIALFADAGDAKALGESSVIYSRCKRWPGAARRIYQFNPEARLIYMVRHPLRRIESAWTQQRNADSETSPDFGQSVRSDHASTLDATLYWKQLSEYHQFFPDEQILLLFFEEFIADEAATLRRCFEFLKVDAQVTIDCSTREQQNAFASKREPIPLLDLLRKSALFRRIHARMPLRLKDKLQFLWTRPMQSKPRWDAATFQYARDYLFEDTQQLLRHAGKPADFWNWELKPDQKIGDFQGKAKGRI